MELTDKTIHQHYKGGLYVKVEEDVLHTETTEDDLVCYKSIITQKPYVRPRVLFEGVIHTDKGHIFRFKPTYKISYREFLFYSTLDYIKDINYRDELLDLEDAYKYMVKELGFFDKDTHNNLFERLDNVYDHGEVGNFINILDKALAKEYPSIYTGLG